MIIAVDGPAGSGKSTVSKVVAKNLGITYLDSGALYRACAYIGITHNLTGDALCDKVSHAVMEFDTAGNLFLTLDGRTDDISKVIRTPEIAANVSAVAAMEKIRAQVNEKLRYMASKTSVIMDGRDIGTFVFPDADYKFFLVASPRERARRRLKDYEAMGLTKTIEEIEQEIIKRDKLDSEREHAPLKKAENAEEIDTTDLTIEEVISIITARVSA
ncbi:MAG: (d)CMP kinase [Deferribacterales bacterium]